MLGLINLLSTGESLYCWLRRSPLTPTLSPRAEGRWKLLTVDVRSEVEGPLTPTLSPRGKGDGIS
jgi:hypothetical protein